MSTTPPQFPQAQAPKGPAGKQRNIGTSILLAIVTLGIYTAVWTFKTQEEIKQHSGEGMGGALGVIIFILLSPATYFLVPSETKKMLEADGRQSPVKPTIGFWFLLPIIGNFIWFNKVQGTLNEYWASKGAAAA